MAKTKRQITGKFRGGLGKGKWSYEDEDKHRMIIRKKKIYLCLRILKKKNVFKSTPSSS